MYNVYNVVPKYNIMQQVLRYHRDNDLVPTVRQFVFSTVPLCRREEHTPSISKITSGRMLFQALARREISRNPGGASNIVIGGTSDAADVYLPLRIR